MAVKVNVIGPANGRDIEIFGNDAVFERIHTKEEVLIIKDVNNVALALVPVKNVRFVLPIETTDAIPKSFGANTILNVHIEGDIEGDFAVQCNRIEYTRKYETLNAELMNVIRQEGAEPVGSLQAVVPFKNIRYVDFNFVPVQATAPVAVPETEETAVVEAEVQPATGRRNGGGNFSIKSRNRS